MRTTSIVGAFLLCLAAACGGGNSRDCTGLCTDAQAGQCTTITGSCTSFCNALDAVDGPSNCTSQRDAYEACLGVGANVCANSCDSQETSLSNCVGTYCANHASDPDCQTLINSF